MKYAREILFFSVIAIFLATAAITLLGLVGWLEIKPGYLDVLFTSLIVELVAVVIALFKATDWFGTSRVTSIEGSWWQLIRHDRLNAISLVQIKYSEDEQQFVLEGEAYTAEGKPHSSWWSTGAALNSATLELRYFWKGDEEVEEKDFSGVGFYRFHRPGEDRNPDRADGWHTTGDIDRLDVTGKIKAELRRLSEDEARTVTAKDTSREEKGRLASEVFSGWKV